jgi:hypothetical protein
MHNEKFHDVHIPFAKYNQNDQVKEEKKGRAYSTKGRRVIYEGC